MEDTKVMETDHASKGIAKQLSKYHIGGAIFGGVSALAFEGVLFFSLCVVLEALYAPVGFYPFAAISLYAILLPFWRWNKRRKNEPLIEGWKFKLLEGIAWGSAAVGFPLYMMTFIFGIDINPIDLRSLCGS